MNVVDKHMGSQPTGAAAFANQPHPYNPPVPFSLDPI
jgi:deoxyribose-phosphate aldolase